MMYVLLWSAGALVPAGLDEAADPARPPEYAGGYPLAPVEVRFRDAQESWLTGSLRPALEQWLMADRPVWAYVDRADTRRIANIVWAGSGRAEEASQALFRALVFDRWLQVFRLRL